MSKKKNERKPNFQEAKGWCYCSKHELRYVCEDGCPKCNEWEALILCASIEQLLIILIAVYMILAVVLGLVRGWNYLKSIPDEKVGKEYHWHNERIALILAGFSLTALSLFLSVQFKGLAQISSTLIFFSIAFSVLILSTISIRLRFRKFFVYLSDVLLNAGYLAIGCGFLTFFVDFLSWSDGSTIVFAIFVIVLFFVSLLNYFFFDRYTEYWRGGEKTSE